MTNKSDIRKAAQEMREWGSGGDPNDPEAFMQAVADWLDATADRIEMQGNHSWRGSKHASKVARTYLG